MKNLGPELVEQLRKIEPQIILQLYKTYPCAVELEDGSVHDCVYFVESSVVQKRLERTSVPFAQSWLDISTIKAIRPSRKRVPPKVADYLYTMGETGMGYYDFRLYFWWVFWKRYLTGTLVDFVDLPWCFGPSSVTGCKITISRGKTVPKNRHLEIAWCEIPDINLDHR